MLTLTHAAACTLSVTTGLVLGGPAVRLLCLVVALVLLAQLLVVRRLLRA